MNERNMTNEELLTARRVTAVDYGNCFPCPTHVFLGVAFNELNRQKCESIHYLLLEDTGGKVRCGIILGERNGVLRSPFSAPFGGLEERGNQKLPFLCSAVMTIREYARKMGCGVEITFPPACYDCEGSTYTRQALASLAEGATQLYADFNYHLVLDDSIEVRKRMRSNARRNLAASQRNGLSFSAIESPTADELAEIYEIIRINHTTHGYPVHLSLEDIKSTSRIVKMYYFIVRDEQGKGIASSICYRTSQSTVQLIYWGDIPESRNLRPMNFLSYNIEMFLRDVAKKECELKFFDLGPASSDGVPAVGLCDFKESLGSVLTPKITVRL